MDAASGLAEGGLTEDERRVADASVALWNTFVALPGVSADDLAEVRHAVHVVQGILAVRALARAYPAYWRGGETKQEGS